MKLSSHSILRGLIKGMKKDYSLGWIMTSLPLAEGLELDNL